MPSWITRESYQSRAGTRSADRREKGPAQFPAGARVSRQAGRFPAASSKRRAGRRLAGSRRASDPGGMSRRAGRGRARDPTAGPAARGPARAIACGRLRGIEAGRPRRPAERGLIAGPPGDASPAGRPALPRRLRGRAQGRVRRAGRDAAGVARTRGLPGWGGCGRGRAGGPPKAAASRRAMPIWKAYTEALPARTVEEKLEKGWLREEVEMAVKRYEKLPQWKKDMYNAQIDYERELSESGRCAYC